MVWYVKMLSLHQKVISLRNKHHTPPILEPYGKVMVSVTRGVSLSYRPCYKNMLNYDNDNKCRKLATT